MFLVPLLGAGVCDALVLYLRWSSPVPSSSSDVHDYEGIAASETANTYAHRDDHGTPPAFLYGTAYVVVISAVRLLLLLPTMAYYRQTGRRIMHSTLYHSFHILCAGSVILHLSLIGISMDLRSHSNESDREDVGLRVAPPARHRQYYYYGSLKSIVGGTAEEGRGAAAEFFSLLVVGLAELFAHSSRRSDDAGAIDVPPLGSVVGRGGPTTTRLLRILSATTTVAATAGGTSTSLRRVVAMLLLNLASTALHGTVMRHLRTTAPRIGHGPGSEGLHRKKKRRLAYQLARQMRQIEDRERRAIDGGGTDGGTSDEGGLDGGGSSHSSSASTVDADADLHYVAEEDGSGALSSPSPTECVRLGINEKEREEGEERRELVEGRRRRREQGGRKGRGGGRRSACGQSQEHENGALQESTSASLASTNSVNMAEFLGELQVRIETARMTWSVRLEEVTRRIQTQVALTQGNASSHHLPLPTSNPSDNESSATSSRVGSMKSWASVGPLQLIFAPLSPFRLLLQLFAYEEVLETGKLDACFDADNGEGLTFYVPQLLSFLLHGAYLNSEGLERFILERCAKNVHFAHRCFWFLRAWCLGGGVHQRVSLDDGLGNAIGLDLLLGDVSANGRRSDAHATPDEGSNFYGSTRYDSETNLYKIPSEVFSHSSQYAEGVGDLKDGYGKVDAIEHGLVATSMSSSNSHYSATSPDSRGGYNHNGCEESSDGNAGKRQTTPKRQSSKFNLEEHAIIEGLLSRIIEYGEVHSQQLDYGKGYGEEGPVFFSAIDNATSAANAAEASSTSADTNRSQVAQLSKTAEEAFIPKDPCTGSPSMVHVACVNAQERCGLLPSAFEHHHAKHLFLAAPRFLDALTSIADDLMLVQRDKRTSALRTRLRSLEVELLPSNVIYLPFGNMYHRVWRIVANESIALSTKERVPCIVTMEVIDYNISSSTTVASRPRGGGRINRRRSRRGMSERERIWAWCKNARPPQRHNTFFEKISSYTNQGLKKIKNELEVKRVQNAFATANPNKESNHWDFVGDMMCLKRVNTKSDSSDEDSDDSDEFYDALSSPPTSPDSFKPNGPSKEGESSFDEVDVENDTEEDDEVKPLIASSEHDVLVCRSSSPLSQKIAESPDFDRIKEASAIAAMGQWGSPGRAATQKRRKGSLPSKGSKNRSTHDTIGPAPYVDKRGDTNNCHANANGLPIASAAAPKMSPLVEESNSSYGSTRHARYALQDNGHQSLPDEKIGGAHKRNEGGSSSSGLVSSERSGGRPPFVVFKEDWAAKEERLRRESAFGHHPGWRLLPVLVKSNDDLRQEQLASQLIQRMAAILARANVPVWLYPYEIVALTDRGGIMEAIPDTISLDSLKRNDPSFTTLRNFFLDHFGPANGDCHADAKANFVESLAAYSMVCFLLQIKDRHNGNILLTNRGHLIHIDFGFFFLSSPGKNSGFESAPFKLTRDFVTLMDEPSSRTFAKFRDLCIKTFLELRKHCYEIILLVEMIMEGNEDLACFRGRPEEAVTGLRERFRLDLNDNACVEYVNSLVDESLENWRTRWYDRYQRFCVGVL